MCFGAPLRHRRREVLNPRMEKNLVLRHGEIAEGWLLATSISKIPPQYSNFAVAPFRLTVWDQFGDEIGAAGRLSVLRRVQRDTVGMRKGTGPYGLDATGKPGSSPPKKTRGADICSCSPRRVWQAAKGSTVTTIQEQLEEETEDKAQRSRRNRMKQLAVGIENYFRVSTGGLAVLVQFGDHGARLWPRRAMMRFRTNTTAKPRPKQIFSSSATKRAKVGWTKGLELAKSC